MRHFRSTSIIKRHDAVTLETEDGMIITITNGINIFKSLESGFPHEVCNCFLFGFPCYWEELADKRAGKESTNKTGRTSSANGMDAFPDDLPVAHVRDILKLSSGDSARHLIEKCICSHIPRKQGDSAFKDDAKCAKTKGKRKRQEDDSDSGRTVAADMSDDATRKIRYESNVEKKRKDKYGVLCSIDLRKQGDYAVNDKDELSFTRTNGKCKIQEDNKDSSRFVSGYLLDDVTPKTQKASKVKKSKNKSSVLCSMDPRKQQSTFCNDDQNRAKTECKHKRHIDDNNGSSRFMAGDLSNDASPKTQIASKVKKSKDNGLSSAVPENRNTCTVETVWGMSIDENSSRRTTRSMRRLNYVGTKGGQI